MNIHPPDYDPSLRWLVLDLNSFFASCEQQENPALRDKPVVVAPVLADTTCAIAASYQAKSSGIKTGTLIRQAKQLQPGLIVTLARPKLYVAYHHKIRAAIETVIPIETAMSIDEVACKLDRTQRSLSGAKALALALKNAIRRDVGECLTSSIGVAANPLLAKLASDMQKPDGLTLLPEKTMPYAIAGLALQDIPGIGPNMSARLKAAGIRTVMDLWSTEEGRLRHIWRGLGGLRFHALLHGADLPSSPSARKSLSHQHVLAPEERDLTRAWNVLRHLLVRAALRLRQEGFFCQRLVLSIKWLQNLGGFENEARFRQTQDTGFLLKILDTLWREKPPFRPLRLGVTLTDLTPQERHQPDLFDRRQNAAVTQAVDAINARFGKNAIAYGADLPPLTSKIAFQRVPELEEFD